MRKIRFGNKNQLLWTGLAILAAILLPLVLSGNFPRHVMTMIVIWIILGQGWNFIGGYAGQISNGHSLFFGLGAYTCALSMQWFRMTPWISMWFGVLISITIAFLIGKPLLRLKDHIFAIATMAVAECARIIFLNTKLLGGATGVYFYNQNLNKYLAMQFKDNLIYYYVYLFFALAVLALVKYLDKSKFCYYLRAIKGNEVAAQAMGIDTPKYKMLAYMLSAAIVSLGGSLYAQFILYIDPSMLMTLKVSMMIVLVVVMGGLGTVIGPVLGAIILTVISEYSRAKLGKFGGFDMVLYGVLVIFIVLFLPNGILSLMKKKSRRAADGTRTEA
jgi:branched-chain amino acid transport system permease protein